jgi:O-antigen ligase
VFTRRNLAIVATLAVVLGLVFFLTPVGDLLLARFEEMGTQSGLRFSIWRHTLAEIADHPWLGRGFDYGLEFINYSGEHITTTHSVYLGSLLKGGIIGLLLLLAVIASGLWRAWPRRQPIQPGDFHVCIDFYGVAGDVYRQQPARNLGAVLATARDC